MLPKATGDGLSDSCPGGAELPETVSDTRTFEFAPSRESVRDRFSVPVGLDCTLNGTLCPAPTTSGGEIPRTCKSELEPVIELIVTEEAVLFDSVSDTVLLLPFATVPKSRLAVPTTTLPPLLLEPPADTLWQPASNNENTTMRREPSHTPPNR